MTRHPLSKGWQDSFRDDISVIESHLIFHSRSLTVNLPLFPLFPSPLCLSVFLSSISLLSFRSVSSCSSSFSSSSLSLSIYLFSFGSPLDISRKRGMLVDKRQVVARRRNFMSREKSTGRCDNINRPFVRSRDTRSISLV